MSHFDICLKQPYVISVNIINFIKALSTCLLRKCTGYLAKLFSRGEMTVGTLRPVCAVSAHNDIIDVCGRAAVRRGAPAGQILSIVRGQLNF